jgi:hypothetical protein
MPNASPVAVFNLVQCPVLDGTQEELAEFQPEAQWKFFDALFLSTFTSPVNLWRAIASHSFVFARSISG